METGAEDDQLYSDPELVEFYDLVNSTDRADHDFCRELAKRASSVLDLGCGTGQLAASLAKGRSVTGVDPARAMLDVARARPGGEEVTWVEADARTVRLGQSFDLVLLTGHAFQCFLTAVDQLAVLHTIAAHLAPAGQFIFDSRNPHAKEWLEWTPERSQHTVIHPRLGPVTAWHDTAWNSSTGVATYQTHYLAVSTGKHITSRSDIAFPAKEGLQSMLAEAGLKAVHWLGDWSGSAYTEALPEIIPIGRLG